MKTIQLITVAGFALFIATAGAQQQVSLQEVRTAAVSSLKSRTGAAVDEQAIDTVFSLMNSRNNTLMYECRFSDGQTVLMSGSKACIPVLGYYDSFGSESVFDSNADIPDGLKDFLSEYQEQIEWCFANDTITLSAEAAWQRLQGSTGSTAKAGLSSINNVIVAPLITTKWDQWRSNDNSGWDCNAYNYYAPMALSACNYCVPSGGEKCLAGCVAVAMAQIMNYWKHPLYNPLYTELYDWCNMPDKLLTTSPNYMVERDAVARLIRDCGKYAEMEYCKDAQCASSSSIWKAKNAFVYILGYNSSFVRSKDDKSDWKYDCAEWEDCLKNSLTANPNRPVLYGSPTHVFVCDGYGIHNGYDYFHFNWGWSGKGDGWFILTALTPEVNGTTYNHTSGQQAICEIHPDPTKLQSYCNESIPLSSYYHFYNTLNPQAQNFAN